MDTAKPTVKGTPALPLVAKEKLKVVYVAPYPKLKSVSSSLMKRYLMSNVQLRRCFRTAIEQHNRGTCGGCRQKQQQPYRRCSQGKKEIHNEQHAQERSLNVHKSPKHYSRNAWHAVAVRSKAHVCDVALQHVVCRVDGCRQAPAGRRVTKQYSCNGVAAELAWIVSPQHRPDIGVDPLSRNAARVDEDNDGWSPSGNDRLDQSRLISNTSKWNRLFSKSH